MTLKIPSSKSLKFHVKYFKNDDRYDFGVNRNRIGNQPWAIDLSWMTLNRPRSRSQNFRIKYLEYCERYHVRHTGGQIGNQQCASYWHHDLWPWITLNSPSLKSLKLHIIIFKMMTDMMSGERRREVFRLQITIWNVAFHAATATPDTLC